MRALRQITPILAVLACLPLSSEAAGTSRRSQGNSIGTHRRHIGHRQPRYPGILVALDASIKFSTVNSGTSANTFTILVSYGTSDFEWVSVVNGTNNGSGPSTSSGTTSSYGSIFGTSSTNGLSAAGGNQTNGGSASWLVSAVAVTGIVDRSGEVAPKSHDPPSYHSCFVSYQSADADFVDRLVADLRNSGVACWYAPDNLHIGASIRSEIGKAIRSSDKVLLVLSSSAVRSPWVEAEFEIAFSEERRRGQNILFPVRIDMEIVTHEDGWAGDLQRMRNVGDFTGWRDERVYQLALNRVLHDLRKA